VVRLDATISYTDTNHEVGVYAHDPDELKATDNFMKVYSPSTGDECYISYDDIEGDGLSLDPMNGCSVDGETVAWWHMSSGHVLGVYDGRLLEYEPSTLAPLGLIVGQDELEGKRVVVVGSGVPDECKVKTAPVSEAVGMEGADCLDNEGEEQAVLLVDDVTGVITVVQPNEDGSYWRKIVRNKMIRMKEKRRTQAAKSYAIEELAIGDEEFEGKIVSSWGPYTSIVGTAVKTGVAGLTAEAELTAKAGWDALKDADTTKWASTGDSIAAAFAKLDTDGDGSLSVDELAAAIREVAPKSTDTQVSNMVSLADSDSDGVVTLSEFVMLMLFNQDTAMPMGQRRA